MVQGSLIDAEDKGISTIEIMNYLVQDIEALGNHEIDYELSHLLFLGKIANFPSRSKGETACISAFSPLTNTFHPIYHIRP